jgi:large subunit ribosomal protein L29
MMKASEIRDWDDVEIRARLEELREERFRLRFRMGTMQLENPKTVQHIRRDVARLNTILRERELTETSETSGTETSQASERETSEVPETAEQAE